MSDGEVKEGRGRQEMLLAVRMKWLHWLSRPIQLLWYVVVEAALALWRLLKIAAGALRGCYDRELLKKAAVGGSLYLAVILLFAYSAGLTGLPLLATVGMALSLLPLAWAYGEVTAVAKVREEKGGPAEPGEAATGNGMRVAGTMALYVVVLLAALLVQSLLSLLTAVPGVGPVMLGIVLIPNVILSAVVVVVMILLTFSLVVLPSHFLMAEEKPEGNALQRFTGLNSQLLDVLKGHSFWLQVLITGPVAAVLALVAALPMILLVSASLGLSTTLIGGVTSFSETAAQSLQGLNAVLAGGVASLSFLPVSVKVGMFLVVLALSVIFGTAMAPFLGGMASVYHRLYRRRAEGKTWTFVVLLVFLGLFVFFFGGVAAALAGGLFEYLTVLLMY